MKLAVFHRREMNRNKSISTSTAGELARALGLASHDAIDIELRSQLNEKIIRAAEKSDLTHAQIARMARTSRSRVTAVLNRNTHQISTDLLLRILGALGYRAKLTFYSAAPAA